MKNQTYDLINNILLGLWMTSLCLIFLTAIIYIPASYITNQQFRSQCLDNNKTYFEFKTIDGFPISGKYCGDITQLKEIIKEVNKN